nr:hypothetical protein [uncultured Dyadobacter sp.]
MEALNLEILNPGPILADLRMQLQSFSVSQGCYLGHSGALRQPDVASTDFGVNPLGIRECTLPEILHLLGIRSVTLYDRQGIEPLRRLSEAMTGLVNDAEKRAFLMSDTVSRVLQPFLRNCRTVAFHDWASLAGASDLWRALLQDVLKPVGKQGTEFIFYLGDPLDKRTVQVEEAIDIITGFSGYGQVTVALDEEEAIGLWMVLNGVHAYSDVANQTFPDLKRKYISIFRTINIDRLLVYSATQAILFTRQAQLLLARRKVAPSLEIAAEARAHFMEGFCIGFIRQLDIVRCLALGLIVFGSRSEQGAALNRNELIGYIDQWAEDLQERETMFLYQ